MNGQIFISYRREESRWSARSLHDRLRRDFDPRQIFLNIDAIAFVLSRPEPPTLNWNNFARCSGWIRQGMPVAGSSDRVV